MSLNAVRNHVSNVLLKLKVAYRTQVVIRAREAGMGKDGRNSKNRPCEGYTRTHKFGNVSPYTRVQRLGTTFR